MSGQDALRLDRIELTNFRCFAECAIDLHPELTVLVADNGKGKTALLDAIGIALGLYLHTLDPKHHPQSDVSFARGDARVTLQKDGAMLDRLPVSVRAHGVIDGRRCAWQRTQKQISHLRSTDAKAGELTAAAKAVGVRLLNYVSIHDAASPVLPVIALYSTARLWSEARLTEERRRLTADQTRGARTAGYLDCLSSTSSFKTFAVWYETMMEAIKGGATGGTAIVSGAAQADRPELLVAAVEQAVRSVLAPTGWANLGWEPTRRLLTVAHADHGRLPVAFLSDGVRTMIALVADIAHRCVRLNPHWGVEAAKLTPGIVLIDEVDMHLHPGWQQTVVGRLREAFPKIQFVVTTHSPQVLSTVDMDSIQVLHVHEGIGAFNKPIYQTRGVESADVLARVMGVHPVPQVDEAVLLSEYRAHVERGDDETDHSKRQWASLVGHFGENHPIIRDVEVLRRFHEFRRSRNLPEVKLVRDA